MTADECQPSKKGDTSSLARQRRNARIAAIQALYEIEMTGIGIDAALLEFLENRWKDGGQNFDSCGPIEPEFRRGLFTELVRGTAERQEELDNMITAVLGPKHSLARLEMVLRAILRVACYELTARMSVPARVVIAEYMAISHEFFSGKEPTLANGVLDRLAWTLRPDELEATKNETTNEEQ
jgi:N utilization substance protein B